MDWHHIGELFSSSIARGWSFIERIEPQEAVLLAAVLIVSFSLSTLIGRMANRIVHRDWKTRLADYLVPLLSSILTILSLTLALAVFQGKALSLHLFPFALKIAIAWFAIRLVMLMSSNRSAGWVIALIIIPITLLHLFEVWTPLSTALESWQFSIGKSEFTAYTVLKACFTIAMMFWLVSSAINVTEQRLKRIRSMRASNRVLIMKIFQIALYLVAFLIALQILGVSLTALSVFGGALGVGIGFGLQKIASNFISGIILLFERSIRVDDLVELSDGTTGFIRHTGGRYTLLETPDGKEMLIPNEDFITQRMTSWTYSSRRGRVEIKVGISYDSDLHLARLLMLEAAQGHPRCIKDPAPTCNVDAFAENSINLTLHFWVGDVTEGRAEPRSEVMLAIWDAFKANHITIPFPQREIRIVSQHAPTQ